MISIITLGLIAAQTVATPMAPIANAKQINFVEDQITEVYVQKVCERVNNEEVLNYDGTTFMPDILNDILGFESYNELITEEEITALQDYVDTRYASGSLNIGPGGGINDDPNRASTFGLPLKPHDIFDIDGGGGGGTPRPEPEPPAPIVIPEPLTEAQIHDTYGKASVKINDRIDGHLFVGIEANTAACVSIYNALIGSASIEAVGGAGLITILLEGVRDLQFIGFISDVTVRISKIVHSFIQYVGATVAGKILAILAGIVAVGIASAIAGMFYCGAHNHGYRAGLLFKGWLNIKPICEEYN